jgi:uncharacterized membrane protein
MAATALDPGDARATLASPAPPAAAGGARHRLDAVDLLRGFVIAVMVLDHVRDYFNDVALVFSPTDLARTTPAYFATRWVTHLCAPTFAFLAGVGAYLQRERARARGEPLGGVARYLLTRGLWLVVLEVTVVGFALDFTFPFAFLQIIWAIGVGFVTLAALVRLPPAAALLLGAATVVGHQALAAALPPDAAALRFWLSLGPLPGPFAKVPGFVAYPALPWAGIVWLGYGLGRLFTRADAERRRAQLLLGLGMLALFAALRLANGYGDPRPWAPHPRGPVYTLLAFLDVSKYPPSLDFVLATLGVSLPLGLALERLRGPVGGRLARVLLAFGRTPMFTYLVHLFAVHGLALLLGVALGFPAASFVGFLSDPTRLTRAGWGIALDATYVVWLAILALLYPLSRWYMGYRARSARWWVRYV